MATIRQEGTRLLIETTQFQAAIQTEGYVSGVAEGSFVDRKTGSRDPGYGLLIVDFLLEPGASAADTPLDRRYVFGDAYHGNIPKRYVALPQICTQAKRLPFEITRGEGFVAVRQWHTWDVACPPYRAGSKWEQHLLFPDGKRWFLAWDRFACADDADCVMMRMDMPGHIKHHGGDVFKQVYLSYHAAQHGLIPQHDFHQNFPPDAHYLYRRNDKRLPKRIIRAMQLESGVWLAGMALDPSSVYEAWCHQRDYVCFIQEIGGRAVKAGEWTGAVHLVGYFDSLAEMERTYDPYRGATGLNISPAGWRLEKKPG
jgi:hypothetical protein